MRIKSTLLALRDISVLYQYLYMDEKHTITFNNGITDLTLRMTDGLSVLCKNQRFPNLPESNWTEEFTPANCLSIIEILKEMPPEEFKNLHFENRWEEIKTITHTDVSLNRKIKYQGDMNNEH